MPAGISSRCDQHFLRSTVACSADGLRRRNRQAYQIWPQMAMLHEAGGFIADGRVNGDLSLSRALGDFRHKCVAHLPPAKQPVSALFFIALFFA